MSVFTALNVLSGSTGLLLLPLYLAYLQPIHYGSLAALSAAAALYGVVANLRLDAALRTFQFDHAPGSSALESYVDQIIAVSFIAAVVLYLLLLSIGESLFAATFAHDELRFYPDGALAFAAAGASACLSCYYVYLRNSLMLRQLCIWQFAVTIATLGAQIVLVAVLGQGLTGALWGTLLPQFTALVALVCIRPQVLRVCPNRKLMLASLRYAVPLVGVVACYVLGTRMDRFVLERFVPLETLGTYALLVALLGLPTIVLDALDSTIRPWLYPLIRRSADAVTDHPYAAVYVGVGLLGLSLVPLAGALIPLFTEHAAYTGVSAWLTLGITASAPAAVSRFCALVFESRKRSAAMSLIGAARLVALAALLVYLVPRHGIGGALWALLAAETLSALIFAMFAVWTFGAVLSLRNILAQFAAFIGLAWLIAFIVPEEHSTARAALQCLAIACMLAAINHRHLCAIGRAFPASAPDGIRGV